MNSPSAAADVLMSLCGDGDGGLFAAAARDRQTGAERIQTGGSVYRTNSPTEFEVSKKEANEFM